VRSAPPQEKPGNLIVLLPREVHHEILAQVRLWNEQCSPAFARSADGGRSGRSLSPQRYSVIPNLPPTFLSASTVPPNGDVNPYGVAFVPNGFSQGGSLHVGDILVSNFNNRRNLQGTGTTIVDISPNGQQTLFFKGPSAPGALGLTTALGVLKSGFVIVGSVPTLDGSSNTIQAPGSLLIINSQGKVVETLSSSALLDGPWDLTINDQGNQAQVFVSNVLSGTVTRIDLAISPNANPVVVSETQIASGYLIRTDPAALVVGPTGLAYDSVNDILYVASTGDNAIFAIAGAQARTTDAGKGTVIFKDQKHLHGPLALTLTPNGDLITSNGDAVNPDPKQPSELVEFTPEGRFVAELSVDSAPVSAFGLAVESSQSQIHFAAVDDNLNTLDIWTINLTGDPSRIPNSQSLQVMPSSQLSRSIVNTTAAMAGNTPGQETALTRLVFLNTAAVDQLFTGAAQAIQPMSFTGHGRIAHGTAKIWDLEFLPEGTWLLDTN
jgi:hypothetical protein